MKKKSDGKSGNSKSPSKGKGSARGGGPRSKGSQPTGKKKSGSGGSRAQSRASKKASRPSASKGRKNRQSPAASDAGEVRLQKVMARAGVASRRGSEQLISEGEVTINGRIAQLGDRVKPGDAVKVGSKLIRVAPIANHRYLALHKPEGTMTTTHDPEGRQTVFDLVPHRYRRGLMSVGRLDYGTEGLLLLTTDGDFAQKIAHPKYGCPKTYLVKVKGSPDEKTIEQLSKGIRLDGVKLRPAEISPHRVSGKQRTARANTWWKVEVREGKTRQIRRMFERFGHLVSRLRRVKVGPVTLGKLGKGDLRELTEREVAGLLKDAAKP